MDDTPRALRPEPETESTHLGSELRLVGRLADPSCDNAGRWMVDQETGHPIYSEVHERRVDVGRVVRSLTVREFSPGRWIWQFAQGAYGYAGSPELAMQGALEHLGVEVDFLPITTPENLEFTLAASIQRLHDQGQPECPGEKA